MSIVITNPSVAFTEGGAPVNIDSGIEVTSGGSYRGGHITFTVDQLEDGDQFVLQGVTGPAAQAAGAISVDAQGYVYVGTGSGVERIGVVHDTQNGLNGQPLTILFQSPLPNSGFEDGAAHWTISNERYGDNPGEIDFDGYTIPLSTVAPYTGSTGTVVTGGDSVTYTGSITADGGYNDTAGLSLVSTGNISGVPSGSGFQTDGWGSVHGPYATSEVITVQDGDMLSLRFYAEGAQDDYEVFGLLRKVDAAGNFIDDDLESGNNVVLFAERGDNTGGWKTVITDDLDGGEYRFQFVGGTYDGTGGLAVGSELIVDDIVLLPGNPVDQDLVSAIAQQVVYQNTATDSAEGRSIEISAVNGSGVQVQATVELDYTGLNNSPALDDGTPAELTPIDEDTEGPGATVGSLFASKFADPDNVHEPYDEFAGIAISADASTPDEGIWQYSTDNGETWHDVGPVSEDHALLLPADALVRFAPAPDWNGTPGALSAYALDDSDSGIQFTDSTVQRHLSNLADLAADETSPVSDAPVDLQTTIDPVNDAPRFPSDTVSHTAGTSAAPIDGTIEATDPEGDDPITFSIDGGTTTGGISTLAGPYGTLAVDTATGAYTFTPDPAGIRPLAEGEDALATFVVNVSDADGASAPLTIEITVTGSNEAPSFTGPAVLAAVQEDSDPAGQTVADLFGGLYEDPDAAQGPDDETLADVLGGIAIAANDSPASAGAWQYSLDDGETWSDVGAVSPEHALLLPADALVRFAPAADWHGTPEPLSVFAVDSTFPDPFTDAAQKRYFDTSSDDADAERSPVSAEPVELTTSVTSVNDEPEGRITVTGVLAEGEALTASLDALSDVDGLPDPLNETYQWYRDGVPISGATGETYTLTAADVGKSVTYGVSYTDNDGFLNTLHSPDSPEVLSAEWASLGPALASASVSGGRLTLRYDDDETLDPDYVPDASQYTVLVNGEPVAVTGVAVSGGSGRSVTLTLEPPVRAGDTVTLSYNLDGAGGTLVDTDGNPAAGLLNVPVSNATSSGGGGTPQPAPEYPIGQVTDGAPQITTDEDGNTVTTTTGKLNGATVVETVTEKPDGAREHQLVYTPGAGSGAVDLPLLYEDFVGSEFYTMVSLPAGIVLTSVGIRTPFEDTALDLIELIQATVAEGENVKPGTLRGGQDFLDSLSGGDTLWVNKVVLEPVAGLAAGVRIVFDAADHGTGTGKYEALVIDASALPPGTIVELLNVDFAVVLGDGIEVHGGSGNNHVHAAGGAQTIIHGDGWDSLYGGSHDDVLISLSDKTSWLFGNGGNDTLEPGAGGYNLVHGGSGNDVAVYSGNLADYIIVREHGQTIVRLAADPEEGDTLVNVETIRFADQTYTVNNDPFLSWIATLYSHALDRQPELEGFQYWADQYASGTSIGNIAVAFLYSVEHTSDAGSPFAAATTAADQVTLMYRYLLDREAEAEGHAYWTEVLENGATLEDVAGQFMLSDEFHASVLAPEAWDFFM